MYTIRLHRTLAAIALGVASSSAAAATQMQVFDGYASSRAVLAGRYDNAIEIAGERESTSIRFYRVVNATSLCVAFAKTGRLDDAQAACDRAVSDAAQLNVANVRTGVVSGFSAQRIQSVVTANRDVVAGLRPVMAAER